MNPFRLLGIAALLLVSLGCKSASQAPFSKVVDTYSFQWFGGTLFSTPQQLTMKAVHLDQGFGIGKDIIIEGRVLEYGKNETFLIVADETARMLVVLTHLNPGQQPFRDVIPRNVRIMGTVERGKRGFPFILARAYSPAVPVKKKS